MNDNPQGGDAVQDLINDIASCNTFKMCQNVVSKEAMFSHLGH